MISTAHPTKDTVSVGARGLGGMSYFLHVFWDTEIFVLPFFIYTQPETARTLLKYRYRNLPGARQKAAQMGFRGALYPWESADKGIETTPPYGYGPSGEQVPILSGLMEHHISADVAWGTWEYWKATGDDAFMASMGVEMLLETARFWVSRAARDHEGRYHVRVVVGPDEYHEGVDDNAYTNVLARWNIKRALEALVWLETVDEAYADELKKRLELTVTELFGWRAVIDGYVDGYDPETLLYEQFAGFYDMADVPIEKLRPRPMAADLLLGRDVTLVSKVVKQADVVMLCHVLADEIDERTTRANYDYYEPITCHGSSLSPGIHAAVAARLHDVPEATEYFKMAAAIDLADNMGNAAAGLHMATMGGLWQAAVMGFCGVMRRGEALRLDPQLPEAWELVRLPLRFRGAHLHLDLPREEERRGRGYNRREGAGHPAAGRGGAGAPTRPSPAAAPQRTTLAGGRRMTLLVAVADAAADQELVASARALAAAARWEVRGVHVREPGIQEPGSADLEGLELTAIDGDPVEALSQAGRRSGGGRLRVRPELRVRFRAGLRDGARRGGAAQRPRRSGTAGPAGHAPRRRPQAPLRAAGGQPVDLRRHARRGRRALRARSRDRHAARRDRRHAAWRRAACRRRA